MRTALSKVLQAAVEWNFLEQNPARGIRIGDRGPNTERLYLNSSEVSRLLASLPEPCRTIVLVAVLTGIRIGEILALRWRHLDLLRGSIQIRETVSERQFGAEGVPDAAGPIEADNNGQSSRCLAEPSRDSASHPLGMQFAFELASSLPTRPWPGPRR